MGHGRHTATAVLAGLLAACVACGPAWGAVAGQCSNCHTMHNSQGAEPMAYELSGSTFAAKAEPNAQLLITDCVGCHTATDGGTWQDSVTGAPIVHNTAEPSYGATSDGVSHQGLAAGNFYWVSRDDANGHNIFTDDADLDGAPGDASGCSNDSCHVNFHSPYTGSGFLAGRTACQGCHMVSGVSEPSVTSWHHAGDGTALVDSADQGWYRMLAGHRNGDGHGVSGIESPDWEHDPSSASHNEYLGIEGDKTDSDGLSTIGDSMTGFCVGCHGDFHVQNDLSGGGSPWLRHPADAVIPNSGEFTGYVTYDPLTPVARPALTAVSALVTPGQDMVMCLSCHRAHASPYAKMMRWDYVGGALSEALSGCSNCHSRKY